MYQVFLACCRSVFAHRSLQPADNSLINGFHSCRLQYVSFTSLPCDVVIHFFRLFSATLWSSQDSCPIILLYGSVYAAVFLNEHVLLIVLFAAETRPLTIMPFAPTDNYRSHDDCLEDKTYQNCSVLYCVTQLYSVACTLVWAVPTGELGPDRLGLVSLCVCVCS